MFKTLNKNFNFKTITLINHKILPVKKSNKIYQVKNNKFESIKI